MITPNKIKKSQAKKILVLIEDMTRCEIAARIVPSEFPLYADWFSKGIEKRDELLEFIYGTSDLVELGKLWGMFDKPKRRKKKKKKNQTEGYVEIIIGKKKKKKRKKK